MKSVSALAIFIPLFGASSVFLVACMSPGPLPTPTESTPLSPVGSWTSNDHPEFSFTINSNGIGRGQLICNRIGFEIEDEGDVFEISELATTTAMCQERSDLRLTMVKGIIDGGMLQLFDKNDVLVTTMRPGL